MTTNNAPGAPAGSFHTAPTSAAGPGAVESLALAIENPSPVRVGTAGAAAVTERVGTAPGEGRVSSPPPVGEGSGGPTAAAPSKPQRVIRRPMSQTSINLQDVRPQTRYTLAGLARVLGCSVQTVRRAQFPSVDDGTGGRKYLGIDVINRLRGRY